MRGPVAILAALVACTGSQRVITHHRDGSPKRIVTLVRGKQHGVFRTYHRNGKMAVRGRYANGLPDGEFVTHDPDGKLIKREIYRAGRLVWTSTTALEDPPPELAPGPLPALRPAEIEAEFTTLSPLMLADRVSLQAGTLRVRGSGQAGIGQQYNLLGQFRMRDWIGYGHGTAGWTQVGEDAIRSSKLTVEGGVGRSFPLGVHFGLLRVGIAAPVRHDDMDGFSGRAELVYDRLIDAALAYPRSVAARTSFSIFGAKNWLIYRVDGGLDFAAAVGDAEIGAARALQAVASFSIAGGIGDENVAGTLELVNVAALTDDRTDERFAHSIALTGMLGRWPVRPRLGIVMPLDRDYLGETLSVFAGVSYLP